MAQPVLALATLGDQGPQAAPAPRCQGGQGSRTAIAGAAMARDSRAQQGLCWRKAIAMLVPPSPPGAIPSSCCPALCSRTNGPAGTGWHGLAGAGRCRTAGQGALVWGSIPAQHSKLSTHSPPCPPGKQQRAVPWRRAPSHPSSAPPSNVPHLGTLVGRGSLGHPSLGNTG